MTATLRIKRNNEWGCRGVKFRVLVSGKEVGRISANEAREFSLDPGEYNIQISDGIFKSRNLMVPLAEGQHVNFKVIIPGHETFINSILSHAVMNLPKFELERQIEIEHPDSFRFFVSESTPEALMNNGSDLLIVQSGRFASYIEREVPLPGTGLSVFLNYCGLPEGYVLVGVSFGTLLNSLIIGQDKDFLPVAKHKYPVFAKCFAVFESMKFSKPEMGQIWFGIDRDPNNGAEISVVSTAVPVSRSIVKDAEALMLRIRQDDIRALSQAVMDVAFQILDEISNPIDPISDVLSFKRNEFLTDVQDPRKVCSALLDALMKQYGWPLVDEEMARMLVEHKGEIVNRFGTYIYGMLVELQSNRKSITKVAKGLKQLRE
jgi:hypothetical protein